MQNIIDIECGKHDINKVIDSINILHTTNMYTQEAISIFLLEAQVGMGKTYLVNQYAKTLGLQSSSPSFAFIHEYYNKESHDIIYHYDLYLKNEEDSKLKLLESLQQKGLHFIEWGEQNLLENLQNIGFACALIRITSSITQDSRQYTFYI